jgi:hypothetical protein
MEFAGPESEDFINVFALNRAFLQLVSGKRDVNAARIVAPDSVTRRLHKLRDSQVENLSKTPFLLFSLREREADYWESIFANPGTRDLFTESASRSDEQSRLVAASLGFLWQLAKRNPYAARLICGASLYWCEQIAETTICQLLAMAGLRSDLLTLRFSHDEELWRKLLQDGIRREQRIRDAAQLSALQFVLTRSDSYGQKSWPIAARTVQRPKFRVADSTDL